MAPKGPVPAGGAAPLDIGRNRAAVYTRANHVAIKGPDDMDLGGLLSVSAGETFIDGLSG